MLGPPQTGHIARREFQKRIESDAEARESYERQIRQEKERRHAVRQVSLANYHMVTAFRYHPMWQLVYGLFGTPLAYYLLI